MNGIENNKAKADHCFSNGCNCAQAVLLSLLPDSGDQSGFLRIASCFGGGMSHTNNVCGAVSGALMAIGLDRGMTKPGDLEAKSRSADAGAQFINDFKNKFGSVLCTELLGYNLSNREEAAEAKSAGVFTTKCTKFVSGASEIASKILA